MTPTDRCPQCGDPLPPDAPEGICPKCLMALGLDVKTEIEAVRDIAPDAVNADSSAAARPDHVLLRRAAIQALVSITLAQAALLGLTWGYLSGTEWYFKEELPYDFLMGWWLGSGAVGLANLAWCWYLIVKDPRTPRSLNDFVRVWQTQNPRLKMVTFPMFVFIVMWIAATWISFAVTSSDDAHTIIFSSGFLLGPYVLMAGMWRAYRSPRRPEQAAATIASRPASSSGANVQDPSGRVCAVIALVLFVFGLIVPAILLAVSEPQIGVLTFGAAMVLAVVFGLLGFRYRMGRYTAVAAFLTGGIVTLGWLFLSSAPMPQQTFEGQNVPVPVQPRDSAPRAEPDRLVYRSILLYFSVARSHTTNGGLW